MASQGGGRYLAGAKNYRCQQGPSEKDVAKQELDGAEVVRKEDTDKTSYLVWQDSSFNTLLSTSIIFSLS